MMMMMMMLRVLCCYIQSSGDDARYADVKDKRRRHDDVHDVDPRVWTSTGRGTLNHDEQCQCQSSGDAHGLVHGQQQQHQLTTTSSRHR